MATAEDNLRHQFQLLQDQQQKKLMRRKQRLEEKDKAHTARAHTASVISTSSSAFGVADNLDLKLSEPVPKKGYLSEELVDHLNEQIRELKDENGRVYKLLSERDFELRQLKKKREEEKAALATTGGPVTNETAGTKIVELSKKVRELTAELESEKTKSRQWSKKCQDLQQQVNKSNANALRASATSLQSDMEEKQDDPSEMKQLLDKLKQMESKMIDYRNQNSTLKQELRIAQKVVAQELGENVNIQSCLNNPSSWRGRAQQIIALQQKNEELKQELDKAQGTNTTGNLQAEMLGVKKRSATERHREQLRKLEKEKKEAQEKQAAEKESLEEENFALKHKLDASKTRNQVLSNELKGLKKQLSQLLQKNEHDNELIEALMKNQTDLQLKLQEASKQQHNNQIEAQNKLTELTAKQQHDTNIVEQLKTIVSDKELKVKVLENEIQQLKLAHLQRAQVQGVNQLFQQKDGTISSASTLIDSRPSTGIVNNDTVQVHFDVGSVTPPGSRMTDRPHSGVEILDVSQPIIKPPSAPPSRGGDVSRASSRGQSRGVRPFSGGSVDKRGLTELHNQCQEYKTVAQVAEVERDKLMDLMKVLQHRLDDSNSKLQDTQNELVQQRRKNAMLEKQIGKANLTSARQGNVSARRKPTGKSSVSASITSMKATIEEEELSNMSTEELITNLEIQRDENEALKAALQSTLKAKEEDLKVYSDTIDETKRVFLQALRQYKQSVPGT